MPAPLLAATLGPTPTPLRTLWTNKLTPTAAATLTPTPTATVVTVPAVPIILPPPPVLGAAAPYAPTIVVASTATMVSHALSVAATP